MFKLLFAVLVIAAAVTEAQSAACEAAFADVGKECEAPSVAPAVSAIFGEGTFTSQADAEAASKLFCGSACYSGIKSVAAKHPECMDGEMRTAIRMMAVICSKDVNGKLCGSSLMFFDGPSCANKTQADCTAPCTYTAGKGCEYVITAPFLQGICTGCMAKLAAVLAGTDVGLLLAHAEKLMCAKSGAEWCLLQKFTFLEDVDEDKLTDAKIDAYCANSVAVECTGKVFTGILALKAQMEKMKYVACVEDMTAYTDDQIKAKCVVALEKSLRGHKENLYALQSMCKKNANGVNCLKLMIQNRTAIVDSCYYALGSSQCNTTCNTELGNLFTTWGCCAGTMQQMYMLQTSSYHLPEEIPPVGGKTLTYTNAPTSAPAAATAAAGEVIVNDVGTNVLATLSVCTSLADVKEKLRHTCDKSRAANKFSKTLKLKIKWAVVNANPALKAKLLEALRSDVGSRIGIMSDDFVNADLLEDTSIKVNIAGRRMRTLAEASGTKFTFTAQTESAGLTTNAEASYNKAISDGTLSLPSTVAVANEQCGASCVEGDGTSLQTSAEMPRVGSGSSALFVNIWIALAALLILA